MFIQTETTPNPATLKFLPGRDVAGEGALHDFPDAAAAARSPLAAAIFEAGPVARVFFGADFVAVTKAEGEWQHLKPAVLGAIMEHFQFDRPLIGEAAAEADATKYLAGEAGHRIGHLAQHLHGGIGVDVSYPIHRFQLWSRALGMTHGGSAAALSRLGDWLAGHEVLGWKYDLESMPA
jgi:alkylation response protein AidB-like acyl-CoA dehydrogenase